MKTGRSGPFGEAYYLGDQSIGVRIDAAACNQPGHDWSR
jgi:hypothetical protein